VVLRNLTNGGIEASSEIAEYCLYAITLMTAPWLLSQNQHIRIDALVAAVPYPVAWAMEFLADLIGIAVSCTLVWYGVKVTLQSHAGNSLIIKSMIFPEWWLFAPLPISMLLLAIEFVLRAIRLITGERRAGATTANIT
jgi:TRAP-type C4-dicarboxylate transport system permease small subunit